MQLKHHINIHLGLKPITALSVSNSLAAHPFFYAPQNTQTTAYIGFQLHSMLEEFNPEVPTHSPHGHHAQRAMQPSVEMFCIQKTPHCPVTIVLNSWGPDCS